MSPRFLMQDCVCNLEGDDCLLIVVPAQLYNSVREKPLGTLLCVRSTIPLCSAEAGGCLGGSDGRPLTAIVVLEPYVAVSKVVRLGGGEQSWVTIVSVCVYNKQNIKGVLLVVLCYVETICEMFFAS